MNIFIQKLHPKAELPEYATDGAGCFDLRAAPDTEIQNIASCNPVDIGTGLAFEIPQGHVMLLFSRSGHGFNKATRLANCVGVIDSDYRGEVRVKLTRDPAPGALLEVRPYDRIAQGMVLPVERVTFHEVSVLTPSGRGTGGFGSTGAK